MLTITVTTTVIQMRMALATAAALVFLFLRHARQELVRRRQAAAQRRGAGCLEGGDDVASFS